MRSSILTTTTLLVAMMLFAGIALYAQDDGFDVQDLDIQDLDIGDIEDADDGWDGQIYPAAELLEMAADRRSMSNDQSLMSAGIAGKWVEIYSNPAVNGYVFASAGDIGGRQVIAEARIPADGGYGILDENLAFLADRGYDAVLVASYDGDDPVRLSELIGHIRSFGMKTWLACSGSEDLDAPALGDPDLLRERILAAAPQCEAIVLGWRRTSLHLMIQDPQYTNFVVMAAREANPSIAVIGEAYHGNTALTAGNRADLHNGFSLNVPDGCSAMLVMNSYAFHFSNFKRAPRILPQAPLVAVIMGSTPYYLTRNPDGLPADRHRLLKELSEDRAFDAGFLATVTIFNDGSDGMFSPAVTDDICKTPYER